MKKLLLLFLLAISSAALGQSSQLSQLDGEWYSNQWKYGYTLTNGVGVATSTNSPNFKVGDRILFLQQSSDKTFEGTQVYTDGKFYKITVQQQSNDTLLFKGEKNVSWTMTKKTQTTAQGITSTTSTASPPVTPLASASRSVDGTSPASTSNQNNSVVNAKIETLIAKASSDVVAQALNYVSGFGEVPILKNNSTEFPFYVSNSSTTGLPCTYEKIGVFNPKGGIDPTSVLRGDGSVSEFMKLGRPKSKPGEIVSEGTIDLNRGNPAAIRFYIKRGFSNEELYFSEVEGLGTFYCFNHQSFFGGNFCQGARVQRAWALIYKECKGTRKAF